jgi:hypothetical protein
MNRRNFYDPQHYDEFTVDEDEEEDDRDRDMEEVDAKIQDMADRDDEYEFPAWREP